MQRTLIPKNMRSGVALTQWFIYALWQLRDNANNSVFIEIPVSIRIAQKNAQGDGTQVGQTPVRAKRVPFPKDIGKRNPARRAGFQIAAGVLRILNSNVYLRR